MAKCERGGRLLLVSFGLMVLCTGAVLGQTRVSARAGLISYLEGSVYRDNQPLQRDVQLLDGQTLRTVVGRVELLLGFGAILRLGENGSLRIDSTKLTDSRVILENGSALVEVTEQFKDIRARVYFQDTATEFVKPGLFRWDAGNLRVYGGEAAVSDGQRKVRVKRGQAVALTKSLAISKFDPKAPTDALHAWAGRRSFDLISSPELIWEQKHWQPTNAGRLWNPNFGIEFPSDEVKREMARRKRQHEQSSAELNRTLEKARQQEADRREREVNPQHQPPKPEGK